MSTAKDVIVATGALGEPDAAATMDEQAFQGCYRRTAGPLRAYVVRVMGSVSQADDIVQETYLRLLRKPPATDDPNALRALLIRIASNLMIDHWRRMRREGGVLGAVEGRGLAEGPSALAAPALDLPLRMDMARLFGTLRPELRQLLWLAYVEGASHREIGAALGVKERSVRVMLHRAKRHLAALLRAAGLGRVPVPARGIEPPSGEK